MRRKFAPGVLVLAACTSGTSTTTTTVDSGTATTSIAGCHANPRDADDHALFVAFPYTADAGQSDVWRRFSYPSELGDASAALTLARAPFGRGAWTPDGAIAALVGDDGSVHTLHLDSDELRRTETPYVSSVTFDATGEIAWLVDPNWPENGGGLYRASVDCDTGHLGEPELVWTTKNAAVLALRPSHPGQAALVARELDGAAGIVHFVDLWAGEVLASVDAFGDDEAIVSDATWDFEGEQLLVADHSEFSGVPTRVATVHVDAGPMNVVDVQDPVSLVAAPLAGGNAAVVSGYGNAVYELVRTDAGFELGAKVASPALPGAAVVLTAGAQAGEVVVSENTGLWGLAFDADGTLVDRGRLAGWDGLDGIPGTIALQP